MSSSWSVNGFLEKCANPDFDLRDMAGRDLARELEKETFKLDAAMEKKVVDAVMKLLGDSNNLVQEQAVKCIGPLAKKVDRSHTERIVLSLTDDLIDPKKDDGRDTACIALRNITNDLPADSPVIKTVLIAKQAPKLITAVTSAESQPVKMAALEILTELLKCFGKLMVELHRNLVEPCLRQLASSSSATQKRATTCLAQLATVVSDSLFNQLMQQLITSATSATRQDHIRTHIQCIGSLSHSVGNRMGAFLQTIVPFIAKFCSAKGTDQETRENCFYAFTSLAVNCPKEIAPFLVTIVDLCFAYLAYDPLFEGEEDEPMEDADEEAESIAEGEGEEEEEEQPDDDDDVVYRVRKGAVRTLGAVILSHPEVLPTLSVKNLNSLISRFSERVEDVKLDVVNTWVTLIKAKSRLRDAGHVAQVTDLFSKISVPLVTGLAKLLKSKSVKVKAATFPVLKEFNAALPGCLASNFGDLIPAVIQSLDAKASTPLKIEALSFLRMLMESYPPTSLQMQVAALAPHIFKAITDPMNRVSEEALRLATAFIHVLRPEGSTFDFKSYVEPLYTAILKQAQSSSADQGVKEESMVALGHMLAVLGDAMSKQAEGVKLFISKLSGEVARLSVVKVLPLVVASQKVNLAPHLNDILHEMTLFLKKLDRELMESTLITLVEVVAAFGKDPTTAKHTPAIVAELALLILHKASDLYLVNLAIKLAYTILHVQGAAIVPAMQEKLIPQTFKLIESAMLQGDALESVLLFYGELVAVDAKTLQFQPFLESVLAISKAVDAKHAKPVIALVAQCVGAMASRYNNPKAVDTVVGLFMRDTKSTDDLTRQLSLLCLGQIGKLRSLAHHPDILASIFSLFSGTPETKHAAAVAIGGITVGSMETFLPFLLEQMTSGSTAIQRLLLVSLREVVRSRADILKPHIDGITKLLFHHCDADDVSTRDTVAEVLGKLAITSPQIIVPVVESLNSRSSGKRGTMVSAIKFALSGNSKAVIDAVAPHIATIVGLIPYVHEDKMKQLFVRERAILTVKYIAANHPAMLISVLPRCLPALLDEFTIKADLVKVFFIGKTKYTEDDGLQARKDAYETVLFICKSIIDKVDVSAVLTALAPSFTDFYDVRLFSFQIIKAVGAAYPANVLGVVPTYLPQIMATLKMTSTHNDEPLERKPEMMTAGFDMIVYLMKLPNADTVSVLQDLLNEKENDLSERLKKALGL